MKTKITLALFLVSAFTSITNAQFWNTSVLNFGSSGNTFGTSDNFPINIFTNNTFRGQWTTSNGLGASSVAGSLTGDGLRIAPGTGSPASGTLDLWTAGSGTTHIQFDQTGLIQGEHNNFEFWAQRQGFWFNTTTGFGQYLFNRSNVEQGRLGNNNFWRLGLNNAAVNATRTLEVVDDQDQLRLRFTNAVGANTTAFTDFFAGPFGLDIVPELNAIREPVYIHRLGTTLTQNTLIVNGNARLRYVPETNAESIMLGKQNGLLADDISFRRLAFTGNTSDVLLGDGTWGTVPTIVATNNGISTDGNGVIQLGVPCLNVAGLPNFAGIAATEFTEDRVVANRNFNFWFGSLDTETGGVGIGGQPASTPFCNTGNTLEVSANMKGKYGNIDASGVRLTELKSTSPTLANGTNGVDNTKVLTVDEDGDIVLVDAVGGGGSGVTADNGLSINPTNNVQMGQIYTGTPVNNGIGEFIHNTEVPFAGFNLHFTNILNGGVPGINRVSFGKPVSLSGLAITSKVYSFNGDEHSAIMGHTDGSLLNSSLTLATSGVAGVLTNNNSEKAAGVYGLSTNSNPIFEAIGVWGEAENSPLNVGVQGKATDNVAIRNRGGLFTAANASNFNTGVITFASGPTGSTNYGILASAPSTNPGTNFAGWFEGDVFINSPTGLSSTGIVFVSDQQFKTNIINISNAQNIIGQLQPKEFYFDGASYPQINFSSSKQYGLIAQEVEAILPELVTNHIFPAQYDNLGNQTSAAVNYKSLNYNGFIAILMKGMQEQDAAMDSLKDRLTTLEDCINSVGICENGNGQGNGNRTTNLEVELENLNAIILDQNLPNPFAEKTSINYTIPEEVIEATLLFYDMNGRIIKQVEITERGEGKLTVYGENLKNGIYTYSLIADGELIATKKMLKQ
ncbi:MAG: hypothetical protein COA97_08270 [Flavobacteriales bacterium]|nr:MAG: hypothetical protein COA97_08270 [Flavobacteriales bacterium]